MSQRIHQCLAKGITADGDQMKHGPNGVLARRGMLKIFDDHLECGNWTIPYPDITEASLYSARQNFIIHSIIPGYILKIETNNKTYCFGLNLGKYWKGELPFPVERQKGRLEFSLFCVLVRLILLGIIIFYICRIFG